MIKNCALCGREFEATANAQKYCSDECRQEGFRESARRYYMYHHGAKFQTKKCPICGRKFKGYRNDKYCGHVCADEARLRYARNYYRNYYKNHYREQKENEIKIQNESINIRQYIKTCIHCGREFIAKNHRVGFCSEECRKKEKERQREIQKRYRSEEREFYDLKRKKRKNTLDERAALQKETGLPSRILEAYKDDPQKLNRIKFYYYQNGLAKPCNLSEKRVIGEVYRP